MNRAIQCDENAVLPQWTDAMDNAARALGLPFHPVLVRGWLDGGMFLACIRILGGVVTPAPGFEGWVLTSIAFPGVHQIKALLPEMFHGDTGAGDFQGIVEVRIGEERFLALRTEERVTNYAVRPALILGGPTLERTVALADQIVEAFRSMWKDDGRPRVWGSRMRAEKDMTITEADLILPAEFKSSLFDYLDAFWRAAAICASLRIAPRRGVMFVGAPGTGKTQTIRHLIARYPQCGFNIFMPPPAGRPPAEALFEEMLADIGLAKRPGVVVIEDIDRLFDERGMTPQVFLNALDGLLQVDQPVLWIATSNDPSGLASNVLDRPGRFDRIFVFEMPGLAERRLLLKRFSPWPLGHSALERVAVESDGLSGAHIREVCVTAALAAAEQPDAYGEALISELGRVRRQHEQARRYDFMSRSGGVGFAAGLNVAESGAARPRA